MPIPNSWIAIAPEDQFPAREGRAVTIGNAEVAVFNLGAGRFLAVENRCPHSQGPLADGILSVNEGKGPDILGVVEVESIRAAELLQQALNKRLDPSLHYTNVLMREVSSGRHIAPVLLTRLPVIRDRTHGMNVWRRVSLPRPPSPRRPLSPHPPSNSLIQP